MRSFTLPMLVLGLALAAPPSATAQDSQSGTPDMAWRLRVAAFKSLHAGTTVRVSAKDIGLRTGTVLAAGDSTLVLDGPGRVPYAGIDSMWVRQSHATLGFVVGSLIGTVVALAATGRKECPLSQLSDCMASSTLQGVGIILGSGLLGAIVGSASPSWKPRYP